MSQYQNRNGKTFNYPDEEIRNNDNVKKHSNNIIIALFVLICLLVGFFAFVSNDDSDVQSRQQYKAAEKEVKEGSYGDALQTLSSIDDEWLNKHNVSSLRKKALKGFIEYESEAYFERKDYEQLISLIVTNSEDVSDDEEINEFIDKVVSAYREQVINSADDTLRREGYDAASAIIDEAIAFLGGDAELEEIKDNYAPVNLAYIDPFYEGAVEIFSDGITDNMGNSYESGIRGYMSPSDEGFECYATWHLDGKYDTMTAKGIVRQDDIGSDYTGSYIIYGDDKILYKRDNISSDTKPYDIKLNVSGIDLLKIEMFGDGNGGWSGINSVLVDLMLYKWSF